MIDLSDPTARAMLSGRWSPAVAGAPGHGLGRVLYGHAIAVLRPRDEPVRAEATVLRELDADRVLTVEIPGVGVRRSEPFRARGPLLIEVEGDGPDDREPPALVSLRFSVVPRLSAGSLLARGARDVRAVARARRGAAPERPALTRRLVRRGGQPGLPYQRSARARRVRELGR